MAKAVQVLRSSFCECTAGHLSHLALPSPTDACLPGLRRCGQTMSSPLSSPHAPQTLTSRSHAARMTLSNGRDFIELVAQGYISPSLLNPSANIRSSSTTSDEDSEGSSSSDDENDCDFGGFEECGDGWGRSGALTELTGPSQPPPPSHSPHTAELNMQLTSHAPTPPVSYPVQAASACCC